jgi:hypothetical protein
MGHLPVEGDRFHRPVGVIEEGAAGSLVDTPRLHAHEPVLDDVDATHPVAAGDLVGPGEQGHRVELLSVDGHRVALLEGDRHVLGLVGASSGSTVILNMPGGGASHGSSSTPPS